MFIYINVCISIYMFICVCVYISIYMYICVCVYMFMYVYMYVCIHPFMCVCVYMFICVCVCVSICIYVLYIYIYICIYICIYVCILYSVCIYINVHTLVVEWFNAALDTFLFHVLIFFRSRFLQDQRTLNAPSTKKSCCWRQSEPLQLRNALKSIVTMFYRILPKWTMRNI